MVKPGPAKTPTKLRLLNGESKPSRINAHEPKPATDVPTCPDWFTPDAVFVWDRTVRQLNFMGLLTAADQDALVVYCQAVVKYNKAVAMIDKTDLLLRGRDGGYVKNPAVQMMRDYGRTIRDMANEFGLTPAARVGLVVNDPQKQGRSPERLLS